MNKEPIYYRQARLGFRVEATVIFVGFFVNLGAFFADWIALGFSEAWTVMNSNAAKIIVVACAVRVMSSRIITADDVSTQASEEGAENE